MFLCSYRLHSKYRLAYVPLRLLVLGWHLGPLLVNKGSCRGAVSGLLTCADVLPFNMVSNRPAALRGLLRANLLSEQVVVEYYFVAC